MAVCGEAVHALVELTLLFQETFARTKREKNILDFDDIEHFALSILLRRNENGDVEATETALEYRSHFAEILTAGNKDYCWPRFPVKRKDTTTVLWWGM